MHIYVSGGSGRNGKLVIQEALERGHSVTALVRNPDSLAPNEHLTVVKGSPTSQSDVERALKTPQTPSAIITAINPRRVTENPFSPLSPDSPLDLLASTAQTLLDAIAATPFAQQPKLIVNSSLGVGSSWPGLNFVARLLFRHSTMRLTIKDHDDMDALVRKSGINFVLARPCMLADGAAKKVLTFPDTGKGGAWMPSITRASVGRWLVTAAETNEWDGKSPVLTN